MVFCVELVMGVGPMNLVITNDALYQLSYYRSFSFLITGTNVEVFFLLYKLLPYFYHIEKS